MTRPTPMLSLEEVRPRRWELVLFVTAAVLVLALAASLSLRSTYRLEVLESTPGRLVLSGAGSLLAVGDPITARPQNDSGSETLEGVIAGRTSTGILVRVTGAGTVPVGAAVIVDGPEVRAMSVLASRIMP